MTAATRKAAQRARDKAAGLVTIPPIRAPAELAAWIAEQAQARTCTRRDIILEALQQARASTPETNMSAYIDKLLADSSNRIAIISGEGEQGTAELFTGRRTRLAIRRKINAECCDGDRWALAVIEDHDPARADGYAIAWSGQPGSESDSMFPDID